MRAVSAAYKALLFSGKPLKRADLLTITLATGQVLRFASSDIDLTVGGHAYSHSLVWERKGTTQSIGTSPDSIEIDMYDDGSVFLAGANLVTAVTAGLFKNAIVQIDKLVMETWGDTSPGICGWFLGYVSTPQVFAGKVTITVKSMVGMLGVTMPPTIIQPQCNNSFGDARCGFNVATVTFSGTCTGGTQLKPTASGLTDNQFALGKIKFITGRNAGVSRSVKSNVGGVISLSYPLPNVPLAGDTFNISEGCLRTQAACDAKGNSARFKGAPYVPVPETALEGGSGASAGGADTGTTGISVSGSPGNAAKGSTTYLG